MALQRIGKRWRIVPKPEAGIGVVDLETAGDHADEKHSIEPMCRSHDAGVALYQRRLQWMDWCR